jgi:hypothetical protein
MVALVMTGDQARPPGPITIDVDTPSMSVVTVVMPVIVVNWLNVVGV